MATRFRWMLMAWAFEKVLFLAFISSLISASLYFVWSLVSDHYQHRLSMNIWSQVKASLYLDESFRSSLPGFVARRLPGSRPPWPQPGSLGSDRRPGRWATLDRMVDRIRRWEWWGEFVGESKWGRRVSAELWRRTWVRPCNRLLSSRSSRLQWVEPYVVSLLEEEPDIARCQAVCHKAGDGRTLYPPAARGGSMKREQKPCNSFDFVAR